MTTPDDVFLLPGEMAYLPHAVRISTVLGSCVAICLHDARQHQGGMNHYMVPDTLPGSGLAAGKCGEAAIKALLRLAELAGARPGDLVARIYGGGAVTGHLAASGLDIGRRNVALARTRLSEAGIRVVGEDVLGNHGRRIDFHPTSGQAAVRSFAASQESSARADREARLAGRKGRVLVIDDSATVRRILGAVIATAADLEVCGEAENPFEARERLLDLDPDVLVLDVIMPRLDGLSFLRKLMQYKPIPTVVVSTIAKAGSAMAGKLAEAGAIVVLDKEELAIHQGLERAAAILLPALRKALHAVVEVKP